MAPSALNHAIEELRRWRAFSPPVIEVKTRCFPSGAQSGIVPYTPSGSGITPEPIGLASSALTIESTP